MNNGNDKHDNSHVSGLRCASLASFSSHYLRKGTVANVTFRTAFGHWLRTSSVIPRAVDPDQGWSWPSQETVRSVRLMKVSQSLENLLRNGWNFTPILLLWLRTLKTFAYRMSKWPSQHRNRRSDPCFVAALQGSPAVYFFNVRLGGGRDGQSRKLLTYL